MYSVDELVFMPDRVTQLVCVFVELRVETIVWRSFDGFYYGTFDGFHVTSYFSWLVEHFLSCARGQKILFWHLLYY